MAGTMDILIREMTIADYDQVYGLRSLDLGRRLYQPDGIS